MARNISGAICFAYGLAEINKTLDMVNVLLIAVNTEETPNGMPSQTVQDLYYKLNSLMDVNGGANRILLSNVVDKTVYLNLSTAYIESYKLAVRVLTYNGTSEADTNGVFVLEPPMNGYPEFGKTKVTTALSELKNHLEKTKNILQVLVNN